MARPSTYNFELCKEICDKVADGKNIVTVLKSKKEYPSWGTFRVWKNENNELLTLYARSIQDKAEMVDFEIDAIMAEVKSKKVDSYVGRLLIDTLKWKAAKYYPKMFGDNSKVQLDATIEKKSGIDFKNMSDEDLKIMRDLSEKYKNNEKD